jgi:hypothetical protein
VKAIPKLRLAVLLLTLILPGCSGNKETDGKKKDDNSKLMDRGERPPKNKENAPKKDREDRPPVKKNHEDKPDDSKPPDTGEVKKVASTDLGDEFRADNEATKKKYHGKVLEVTGLIEEMGLTAVGDAYLMLAGQREPVARQIEFVMKESEPWAKVVPGQTATIKARCEILGNEPRFKEGTILNVKGPDRVNVKAADLASAFAKDAAAATKEYGDRYVEIDGEVARKEDAAGKDLVKVTFKTPGKGLVTCEFTGEGIRPLRKVNEGDNVRVVGQVSGYNAAQGIEVKNCFVIAKP